MPGKSEKENVGAAADPLGAKNLPPAERLELALIVPLTVKSR